MSDQWPVVCCNQFKRKRTEEGIGREKGLCRLRNGIDSITSNFQDDAENGFILILPFSMTFSPNWVISVAAFSSSRL